MLELHKLTHCVMIAAFLAVLASAVGRCRGEARADAGPAMTSQELWLSRMIVSEAGYRPGREAFAILHVLEWRRTHLPAFEGWDIVRMGRAYCSGFGGRRNTSNPHVIRARSLRIDQVPSEVRRDVHDFLAHAPERDTSSPCPGAVHWRDRQVPARWARHVVGCRVPTQNVYFEGEP